MTKRHKPRATTHKSQTRWSSAVDDRRPFNEHLRELRRRGLVVAGSVLVGATGAYFVQQRLVDVLLRPSHGQRFIYTSPGGGISFLFEVCLYAGLVVSLPILVYEVLEFLSPLFDRAVKRFIVQCVAISSVLAGLGVAFGYFLGLPLALHFLGHQFTSHQIVPLLTLSEYLSFVGLYLGGSALLFQVPLVLRIINRVKPLSPRRLLRWERYVIVGAFIVAMLLAPTVNIVDQLVLAVPVIVAYQVGIVAVWLANRSSRSQRRLQALIEADRLRQAAREDRPTRSILAAEGLFGESRAERAVPMPRIAPLAIDAVRATNRATSGAVTSRYEARRSMYVARSAGLVEPRLAAADSGQEQAA